MRKLFLIGQKIGLVISGLAAFLILLEISLRLGGFIFFVLQEQRNKSSLLQTGSYTIMCLGESTTGFGGEYSWPAQLQEILNQNQEGIEFRVINKGMPGGNSGLILSKLEDNLNVYNPEMVVAMLGINDGRLAIEYDVDLGKNKITWPQELKTYKLIKLLWLHIVNKKAGGLFGSKSNDHLSCREAEKIFKKAIAINPDNDSAYLRLADCYLRQSLYQEAEDILKKAIATNPDNDSAYSLLGHSYYKEDRLQEAEDILKKAIAINPDNDSAYLRLADCYLRQSLYQEADKMLKKVIAINPNNDDAYCRLANSNLEQSLYQEVENMFKKAIAINPNNILAYTGLGRFYNMKGEYPKAEETLKKAIAISPYESWAYLELEKSYQRQGEGKKNAEMYQGYVSNYRRIKEILDRSKIKLVCVQYPMCSIKPLENIFSSKTGIIFVDNEKIFKDALKNAKYETYFEDRFAADFGHATREGNKLLAENIAKAILRELLTDQQGSRQP